MTTKENSKSPNLFQFIESILSSKMYLMTDVFNEKDYNAFLTNRGLSQHVDAIGHAETMNLFPGLDAKMQYDYLYHGVRKMHRRYVKWPKEEAADTIILCIQKHFQYNRKRAEEILPFFTKAQRQELLLMYGDIV